MQQWRGSHMQQVLFSSQLYRSGTSSVTRGVYSVHNHEGRDHCNEGQVDGQKDKRAQEQRRHHETRQQSANQSLSPFCFFVQLSA
jgi:hypothetical protein